MNFMETRVATITPELARDYKGQKFEGQRGVSSGHVEFLADVMKRGQFNGGSPIQIAHSDETGWVVVDGQHRLAAIALSGLAQDVVIVQHRCASAKDLAELYARIDRGRGRSMVDAMRSLGLLRTEGDFSPTELKHFSRAAVLLARNMTSTTIGGTDYISRSPEARYQEMEKWKQPALMYFAQTRNVTTARLFDRREVVAIGIVTFADAAETAEKFWGEAARDDGLRATDPRKKMLETMRKTPVTSSGIGYLGHAVAACWNAYVEGRSLAKVIVRDPRADVVLLATRYAKR